MQDAQVSREAWMPKATRGCAENASLQGCNLLRLHGWNRVRPHGSGR